MERNFNNEFERFLRENSDQFRVYPSPKVWNGIYAALHTRRKWFGLGIVLLLITGSLVTILFTNTPKEAVSNLNKPTISEREISSVPVQSYSASKQMKVPDRKNLVTPVSISRYAFVLQSAIYNPSIIDLISAKQSHISGGYGNRFQPLDFSVTDELTDQDIFRTSRSSQRTMDYPRSLHTSNPSEWTIESVINSFSHGVRNKRLTFQLSIAPMISYRKLSENKPFLGSASTGSSYPYLYDINSVVTHKPDVGLEFGVTSKYALSSKFRVKAGLQFNINRYDIKAFNTSWETAKIDLRGSSGIDSFLCL